MHNYPRQEQQEGTDPSHHGRANQTPTSAPLQDPHATRNPNLAGLLKDLAALARGERLDDAPPMTIKDPPEGNIQHHLSQLQEELGDITHNE